MQYLRPAKRNFFRPGDLVAPTSSDRKYVVLDMVGKWVKVADNETGDRSRFSYNNLRLLYTLNERKAIAVGLLKRHRERTSMSIAARIKRAVKGVGDKLLRVPTWALDLCGAKRADYQGVA